MSGINFPSSGVTPLASPLTADLTQALQKLFPQQQNLTISSLANGQSPLSLFLINLASPGEVSSSQMPEVLGQMEALGEQLGLLLSAQPFYQMLGAVVGLANYVSELSAEAFQQDSGAVANGFQSIQNQSKKAEGTFFEMINSGKYPDFNSFLKLMLATAQELRQLSSEARQASVEGQYQTVLLQAKELMTVAKENYAAAIKEIEAAKTEAIGQIIGGCISIGAAALSFGVGKFAMGLSGVDLSGFIGTGAQIGGALSSISTGSASAHATKAKTDAADHRLKSDTAQAIMKRLEATLKLQQSAEQTSTELYEAAKSLRDMVLKLHQDMMSAQNQIIQRSVI